MIGDREFYEISDYVKKNFGIHLTEKKKTLVTTRLENYIATQGYEGFSEYFEEVKKDKTGLIITEFLNRITTNHTYFWRECEHFEFLRDQVLPGLIQSKKDKDLRIWSAGCSSGQEPYTLAMIIDEVLGNNKYSWDSKILATDISNKVLEQAKQGIYKKEDLVEIPPVFLQKHFQVIDKEHVQVNEALKREIIFRRLNLMNAFSFKKKLDVIFCRNVMIYFDDETKHQIVKKFYNLLDSGGYLFIGHSESINRNIVPFKYVKPAIYRKE